MMMLILMGMLVKMMILIDDTNDDAYPNDDADANADVKRRGSG